MAQIICYEVYPTQRNINSMRRVLVGRHDFDEKQNHRGSYFYKEISSLDAWSMKIVLSSRGYKYKSYDKRYGRDTKYRQRFFDENKGPYHCAYCGRRLKRDQIEVDHLIPVSQAKSDVKVRTWLHLCGITNVNDNKNLVSSCQRCNRKKSDKMGLWIVKGFLGRHKIFWTIRNIVASIISLILFGIAFALLQKLGIIDLVKTLF